MTDHILDPVRGPQVGHRLEFTGPAAPGQSWTRGSCVSANEYGQMVKGCPAGSDYNRPMPMFALQGTDDLDVWSDDATPRVTGAGAPKGISSALPATGGYELATTEFEYEDAGNDPIVYNVNDQLTCNADGKLIKKTSDSEPTVGIVSVCRNANVKQNIIDIPITRWNHPMLTFWTMFIPATGSGSN